MLGAVILQSLKIAAEILAVLVGFGCVVAIWLMGDYARFARQQGWTRWWPR